MSYESESKLTFGNILLGLLLLGVVVVIGLIVFVYFALTKPSSSKGFTPQPDNPPAQTIDRLSPDGRTLPSVPRSQALSNGAKPAETNNNDTAQQNAADKVAKELDTGTATINARDVATAPTGETKPKAVNKPKPVQKPKPAQTNNDDAANTSERNSSERTLTPTNKNTGERTLEPTNRRTPRNDNANNAAGERQLQPSNRNTPPPQRATRNNDDSGSRSSSSRSNETSGERQLKPVEKPRNSGGGGNNIDNLF